MKGTVSSVSVYMTSLTCLRMCVAKLLSEEAACRHARNCDRICHQIFHPLPAALLLLSRAAYITT